MTPLEWKDSYSVGVDSLDAQHKVLIKLINQVKDIEERRGDITPVFIRLEWYVRNHFSFEEAMMRSAGYPDYDDHVKEHRVFKDWLQTVRAAAEAGFEIRDLTMSVHEYLMNWLTDHILGTDMQYKESLQDNPNPLRMIASLTDQLVVVLEDARNTPGRSPVESALALAHDIKRCTGVDAPARSSRPSGTR